MYDVMLDFETTGTDPLHNGIIQIAAVKFDYASGQIGAMFNQCLHLPGWRTWDEGTRAWWSRQGDTLAKIQAAARDPHQVMREFGDFCLPFDTGQPMRLWAKPMSFEWPFLQGYARDFGVELPFHYRHAVDLNSFTRGMADDPGAEPLDKKVPFDGTVHNAIDDTLHQIKVALSAKYLINQKETA